MPGGNRVETRTFAFDRCSDAASLDQLGQYRRWLRGATSCRISDIDVVHLMRARVIGRLHVVNVGGLDPQDFSFDLIGRAVAFSGYPRPGMHPVRVVAEVALRDNDRARMSRAPLLQRVRACLDGVGRHDTRLILPLMGKRGRVLHVLVASSANQGTA